MAKSKKTTVALDDIRAGSTSVEVYNSGCEVWIYDDANREAIRKPAGVDTGAGGMPPGFSAKTKKGLVVGYSMEGDGSVNPAIFVGKPFSAKELAPARWLEPQRAFLRLPSGTLCIESNDTSRIGPEDGEAGGGRLSVSPGDYTLTLYRLDTEALDRDGIEWNGPWEVLVLTPGGTSKDAVSDLLPFENIRDTSWVGQYSIKGTRADAQIWFEDYWDTFTLNLDAAALKKMGLKPGSYFRVSVPKVGIKLLGVVAKSWDDGRRLPPPADVELNEFSHGALTEMGAWEGAQALFCRREKANTGIDDAHLKLWLPAVVEVLDAKPRAARGTGAQPAQLESKEYYDPGFLALVLSDFLPGVGDLDELLLPDALKRIDAALAKLGLSAQGDREWQESQGAQTFELCIRFYAGLPDSFAVIWAMEGSFQFFFLSELTDDTWVLTGLADDLERFIQRKGPNGLFVPNPRVKFEALDEPIAKISSAHKKHLAKAKPRPAPKSVEECEAALARWKKAAFE